MPTGDEHILLSDENMKTFGFSRFYFPGEAEIENSIWHRSIGPISVKGIPDPGDYIDVPASVLVPLSVEKGNRLVDMPVFSIESAGNDMLPMKMLCERAGWNQTTEDLVNYQEIAEGANFLASINMDGARISLGSGAVYFIGENICWISMILVYPEVRRQGIARTIMEYCIEHIHSKLHIPVIGLDASEMGLGLYESMGFEESSRIWRCKISTSERIDVHSSVNIRQIDDIAECVSYLKRRSVDDKLALFKLLSDKYKGSNYIALSGNKVVGLMMSRPGRRFPFIGPLIADNDEIAANLVNHSLGNWKLTGSTEVFMDIPEVHFGIHGKIISGNPGTLSFPEDHSFIKSVVPLRGFVRMYYMDSGIRSEKIVEYMKKENEQITPFLYSIGGPELS